MGSSDVHRWTRIEPLNCQMQPFVAYATKGCRLMERNRAARLGVVSSVKAAAGMTHANSRQGGDQRRYLATASVRERTCSLA
jgi:hypothetical protein